jgi:hypothetical protein
MTVIAAASRWKIYRQRQKAGRACFEIELPEVELIDALRTTPFWQSSSPDPSHDEICAALQRAVEFWIEQELKNENAF